MTKTFRFFLTFFFIWLLFLSALTCYTAKNMQNQIIKKAENFLTSYEIIPDSPEVQIIQDFRSVFYSLYPQVSFPAVNLFREYSSNDWFYGNWKLIYGYQTALSVYHSDRTPLLTQGNYLAISFLNEAQWNEKSFDILSSAFLDLDKVVSFQDYFPSSPHGISMTLASISVLRCTGTFEGNQFLPVTIEKAEYAKNYHPTSVPDIQKLRDLEDRNLIQWEIIESSQTSSDLITIYVTSFHGYHNDDDVLVQQLDHDVQHNTTTKNLQLTESVVTMMIEKENQIIALAVRLWPLQYALIRLSPVIFISFLILFLITFIYKKKNASR